MSAELKYVGADVSKTFFTKRNRCGVRTGSKDITKAGRVKKRFICVESL
jgi:hypothetical protein